MMRAVSYCCVAVVVVVVVVVVAAGDVAGVRLEGKRHARVGIWRAMSGGWG